jgi:hypothetical protein
MACAPTSLVKPKSLLHIRPSVYVAASSGAVHLERRNPRPSNESRGFSCRCFDSCTATYCPLARSRRLAASRTQGARSAASWLPVCGRATSERAADRRPPVPIETRRCDAIREACTPVADCHGRLSHRAHYRPQRLRPEKGTERRAWYLNRARRSRFL